MEMNFWGNVKALLGNNILVSAMIAWLLSQIAKMTFILITQKKLDIHVVTLNGGMPSSHTASVIAAATGAAISCGFGSAAFAISIILAVIVMNDAAGVRWQTGEQAKVIKKLWADRHSGKKELDIKLKDVMGHKPLEILIGAAVGVLSAVLYALVFKAITGSLPTMEGLF